MKEIEKRAPDEPTEVLVGVQHLLTTTQTQQVMLLDVKRHDFLKDLIQCHVGMGHNERSLLGEIVVKIRDDLDSNVGLSSSRGTNHKRQSRLHARANRLHLEKNEDEYGKQGHACVGVNGTEFTLA
jgi:hypothetical protein